MSLNLNRPYLIAGPCSAESPEQLYHTALALKQMGIDFFRAGVWKPRTHPGDFEGFGQKALHWLSNIQTEFQIPTATEVASASHVEAILKAGLRGVWIGARTTVNPFAVQEIASALAGTGIKVFVKNPVNPDLALWLGALERFQKAGITDPVAVHRGFSVYKPEGYRNAPIWMVPMELKRCMPHISLLCDPSHISGKSQLVPSIAQQAIDLHFDGIMIEVHPNPKEALSDAPQQLTLSEFAHLVQHLVLRTPDAPNRALNAQLEELRRQIDLCDDQMIALLVQRMQIVKEIGLIKRRGSMTIFQQRRWKEVIERIMQQGNLAGLSPFFLEQLFAQIHQEAVLCQQDIMQTKAEEGSNNNLYIQNQKYSCTTPRIGSIDTISELFIGKRAILLVDKKVDEHYKDRLPQFPKILIDAQEKTKSLETIKMIVDELMKLEADRAVWLVGIGGGIVCDIAGFVASIYMRGVQLALVPTTLLAQADAAIGGKNGVNFEGVKNMIGCIIQPQWILCDPELLKTLPPKEIRSGLGEVIKHAFIGDPALLEYIENRVQALLALESEPLQRLLVASHRLKCSIVSKDEHERGLRRILNFGHTVGHAIEAVSGCYTHGEAVAVGMLYAVALSVQYARLDASLLSRIMRLYQQLSLPTQLPCALDDLCNIILFDKKRDNKTIRWILLKEVGVAYQQEIHINEMIKALHIAQESMEGKR